MDFEDKTCFVTRRLTEFGDTPSSRLTLDEFMTIDLEEEQDPPCYKAARRKQKLQLEDSSKVEKVTQEISELQHRIEAELEDRRKKVRGRFARFAKEDSLTQEEENEISEEFVVEETIEAITNCIEGRGPGTNSVQGEPGDSVRASEDDRTPGEIARAACKNKSLASFLRPTAATLGLTDSIEECMRVRHSVEDTSEGGELDLEGLDDAELDGVCNAVQVSIFGISVQ